MIADDLKIALRNLLRNKSFSAINILGLALGMASAVLILLWIYDEVKVGRFYTKSDRLYRVMDREFTDGKLIVDESTPGLLADELKKVFPEIVAAAGLSPINPYLLSAGEKSALHNGCFVGADWLKIYELKLLSGAYDALKAPGSIAISRKLAENYFGNAALAHGKMLRFDNQTELLVTAVFEELPDFASDKYEFLRNWDDYIVREPWLKQWDNYGVQTRLLLRPDANPARLDKQLKNFMEGRDKTFTSTFHTELFLKAEKDAYLYSAYKNGYPDGGRIEYVQLLGLIAVFLIVIAGINFTNLATARSARRAREVGIRKTVGADRQSLIRQFFTEAFLLTFFGLTLALAIVSLVLPAFNNFTQKQLSLPFSSPLFWSGILLLFLITGFFSGSYPALFLSSFRPVKVLKGENTAGRGALFRRGLVVFQFALSMILIVGALIVYRQLNFLNTKDLGYNRENVISVQIQGGLSGHYAVLKEALLQTPAIQSVSHCYGNPVQNTNTTESVTWPGKNPEASISFTNTAVGLDFARTMKLQFVEGRDFAADIAGDSAGYLVNETAARRIGYRDPVGQPLTFWGKPGKIIGVIKDFHFSSLHDPIYPLIIRRADGPYGTLLVRAMPGQTRAALAALEKNYKRFNPAFPFTYTFLDDRYTQLYQSETMVGKLAWVFSALAIFIAGLGLFGLSAYAAEQRIKEIGIRKVLGASVSGIVALLSADFLKLVLLAAAIASPVAWYVAGRWLEGFAYKTDIGPGIFLVAGISVLIVALLTISFQSIRAARMNPVKSLRAE